MNTFMKFGAMALACTSLVACGGTSCEEALLVRMEDGEQLAYRVGYMVPSEPLNVDDTTG